MKILLSGGGTGGHISPILAVAHELKALRPDCQLVYVGERGGKFGSMVTDNQDIDHTRSVFAGKFRRYHGESLICRIVDVKTNLLNLRDLCFFMVGFFQSLVLIKREKPDVIFLKGGFVGVPVGLAAAVWRIPFVTHDSDIMPGLANRLVGRWAKLHATGMPIEYYPYPPEKTEHVGVLVSADFTAVSKADELSFRRELTISEQSRVLLITGGSLGARRVNEAMTGIVPTLLKAYPDLYIIHQVGKGNERTYGPFIISNAAFFETHRQKQRQANQ